MVGIVAVEEEAGVGIAREGVAIGNGAGGVGGAIGAIGAGAEDDDAIEAGDLQGGSEGELLVAATEAVATDGDGGFTAGDNAGRRPDGTPGGGDLAGDGGVHAGDLAGFALDGAGEDEGAGAELAGGAGGGVGGQTIAADDGIADAGEQRVGGLGRLGDFAALAAADAAADGGRHAAANLVAVENGAGSGEGGGVGGGGAGTDDVEIVADDVGEQEGFDAGGGGEARQLTALDARDMFADCVDLVDGGAGGQEEAGGILLSLKGDAVGGQGQEGGGAAGDQANHEVGGTGGGGDLGDALGTGHAALIGDGVAALVQLDAAQFGQVAILDIDQAGGDPAAEDALGGLRHGGSGLACPDHVDVVEGGEVAAGEVAGDGVGGVGGSERGAED